MRQGIPSEWSETTLGRVLQRSPSYGINAAALPRGVGKYPYLRITDIDEAGRVDLGSLPSVRDSASDVFILSDRDIVVARTGASVGKSHLFRDNGEPVVFAGFLIRLTADAGAILPDYLAQFMQTAQYWDWIRENSARSGQPGVNGQQLKTIPLVLPPLDEQQAIAAALSDADGAVAGLERVIAKKRLIKQGAMQDLLTARRRLPGFSGEWEEATLSELADIRSGGTPSTSDATLWDGDIAWVTPTDITALDGRKFLSGTTRTISRAGLRQSSAELLPEGTIVMTSRATIGECAISTIPLTTNQGFKNFIAKNRADRDFLYYLLTSQKKGFIELCSGSTFLEIGKTQLTGYTVRVPETKREQQAISTVLSDMDAEIQTLEGRLTKARAVKEGMMQNLLTGRVRLV
ncbi:restriction endonuclease subunit S [Marivita cryptomonadis]|uniref:restriction endonuclease subunit S n=1 Tax=Marivita cryptomonadis TaxID=505252 RepID=UPI000A1F80E9|nr:restriction endonuclease subunit S [Marivita cryptomonadis]